MLGPVSQRQPEVVEVEGQHRDSHDGGDAASLTGSNRVEPR